MNRFLLTVLAASLLASPLAAQPSIEIQSVAQLGKELTARVDAEPGERIAWLPGPGLTPVKIADAAGDVKQAHVFAVPGEHEIKAILVPPGDADPVILSARFTVEGAPGPSPPVVVRTLAELAGDKKPTIAQIVADGRAGLAQFQTVAQVNRYFAVSYDLAKIPQDHPAAVEIKKRIDAAASGSLADAKVRESLAAALAKIASDLGTDPPGPTPPPVPPVVEGKRLVVVLHEVDDDSSAFANFRVNTANNSAAAQYFKANGHTVQFLEEEQKDQNGQPHPLVEKLKALGVGVPAAFILDPATKAVLYQTKLGPDATADNLVEYTKRGGG